MKAFNQRQLEIVEAHARQCQEAHLGELSVYTSVYDSGTSELDASLINVLLFLAEECERQGSGPLSVYWMATAYNYTVSLKQSENPVTAGDIVSLLGLVEPEVNRRGYRCVPVTFANGNRIGFENIERQIANLVGAQDALEPLEFYIEFEKIHPGADGNGRVGALLYNLFSGTLANPSAPPEVQFD